MPKAGTARTRNGASDFLLPAETNVGTAPSFSPTRLTNACDSSRGETTIERQDFLELDFADVTAITYR